MTGATRQADRLAAKAKANAAFYLNTGPIEPTVRSKMRAKALPPPVVGRPKPRPPGGPGTPDRHILNIETDGPYERRYHATKGYRVGRA